MRLIAGFRESLCAALIGASLPHAAPAATTDAAPAAAHYHCAGFAQLTANTNLSALHKALTLPSAAPVRALVLKRFSGLLAGGFQRGTNPVAPLFLEPLLSDVLETESLGAFSGAAGGSPAFVLALRLDSNRAQLWQDNLAKAFGAPGEPFTTEEFNGWRWNRGAEDSFWIVPARGWLVAGRGNEFLPLQVEYLQQVKRQGRPGPPLQDNWLEEDLDLARLSAWLPDWSRPLKPARLKIGLATEGNNLKMTARVLYPEAIPWTPWSGQMPTDLVQAPLASFTAGRDIAAFLNLNPAFSRLDGQPLTNQFYAWAAQGMPFMSYMAWPALHATNALEKLATEASAAFSPELKQFNGTELLWLADQKKLVLLNLRVMAPTLEAVHDPAGEFLLLSLFPRAPDTTPALDELWKQINGRTNLVYYDWELTGPRLQDWRMLGRLLLTRFLEDSPDYLEEARLVEDRWLAQIGTFRGNTITEITRVSPNELSLIRTAPLGFTGIEIFLLTDWVSTIAPPPQAAPAPPPAH
jgi:hypothetical protein